MPPNQKLIRWFDLLAALLRRRFAVSFSELARDVPAYAPDSASVETINRMFERDKDELRHAGIAIETVLTADGEPTKYRLKAESFYLPYLVLSGTEGSDWPAVSSRPPVAREGYRALPTLSVVPEEAIALRRAADRVRMLEQPALTEDATRALRKLRHDLPEELPPATEPAPVTDGNQFSHLMDAIERRKRVTFTYRNMGRGEVDHRTVEPYGLVFLTGNWYLAAHDPSAGGLRNFRTSRMQDVKVNTATANSPDFTVPPTFNLKAHATSRQAWELGAGDAEQIIVRFASLSGDLTAAMRLGELVLPDGSAPELLRFRVRRRDVFLRWLLAFAGDAVPIAPEAVVHDWRALVAATLAVHEEPIPEGVVT